MGKTLDGVWLTLIAIIVLLVVLTMCCGLVIKTERTNLFPTPPEVLWVKSFNTHTGDGVSADGMMVFSVSREGEMIKFISPATGRMAKIRQEFLTDDPRETDWWVARCADDYHSLYEAVEKSACSKDFPEVTHTIVLNILYTAGLPAEAAKMISEPYWVKWIMIEYTLRVRPAKDVLPYTFREPGTAR